MKTTTNQNTGAKMTKEAKMIRREKIEKMSKEYWANMGIIKQGPSKYKMTGKSFYISGLGTIKQVEAVQ